MGHGQPIQLISRRSQPIRAQIRVPSHPSKQQPLEKFSALSVDKKWVVGVSPQPLALNDWQTGGGCGLSMPFFTLIRLIKMQISQFREFRFQHPAGF